MSEVSRSMEQLAALQALQYGSRNNGAGINVSSLVADTERQLGMLIRFDVLRETHVVDFTQQTSFKDPKIAEACVVVVTDGERGTLSHLTPAHDPELFASDLRALIGRGTIQTMIIGGHDEESQRLVAGLQEHLQREGFMLHADNMDVFGRLNRQVTLYRDHAVVERISGSNIVEAKIMNFPR